MTSPCVWSGGDSAGESGDGGEEEHRSGAAAHLPHPVPDPAPSGQAPESPGVRPQGPEDRPQQHQGPVPLWSGQTLRAG